MNKLNCSTSGTVRDCPAAPLRAAARLAELRAQLGDHGPVPLHLLQQLVLQARHVFRHGGLLDQQLLLLLMVLLHAVAHVVQRGLVLVQRGPARARRGAGGQPGVGQAALSRRGRVRVTEVLHSSWTWAHAQLAFARWCVVASAQRAARSARGLTASSVRWRWRRQRACPQGSGRRQLWPQGCGGGRRQEAYAWPRREAAMGHVLKRARPAGVTRR